MDFILRSASALDILLEMIQYTMDATVTLSAFNCEYWLFTGAMNTSKVSSIVPRIASGWFDYKNKCSRWQGCSCLRTEKKEMQCHNNNFWHCSHYVRSKWRHSFLKSYKYYAYCVRSSWRHSFFKYNMYYGSTVLYGKIFCLLVTQCALSRAD